MIRVDVERRSTLATLQWLARLLGALQPTALVLVETELWPNLITEASDRGVEIAILNGRLSPERMRRYRRWRRLYEPVLRRVSSVGVQSADEAERFIELGARKARPTSV